MPTKPQPSNALRQLLATKLDTFEKLELVVVLQEAGRAMPMTELATQLQVGHEVLRRVADDVARNGLVAVGADDTVQLVASDGELGVIAEGAELYSADRSKVITLLSSIALDRIRGMAARSFADAFQLRRKADDPGDDNG